MASTEPPKPSGPPFSYVGLRALFASSNSSPVDDLLLNPVGPRPAEDIHVGVTEIGRKECRAGDSRVSRKKVRFTVETHPESSTTKIFLTLPRDIQHKVYLNGKRIENFAPGERSDKVGKVRKEEKQEVMIPLNMFDCICLSEYGWVNRDKSLISDYSYRLESLTEKGAFSQLGSKEGMDKDGFVRKQPVDREVEECVMSEDNAFESTQDFHTAPTDLVVLCDDNDDDKGGIKDPKDNLPPGAGSENVLSLLKNVEVDKAFECPICLDFLVHGLVCITCQGKFCSQCATEKCVLGDCGGSVIKLAWIDEMVERHVSALETAGKGMVDEERLEACKIWRDRMKLGRGTNIGGAPKNKTFVIPVESPQKSMKSTVREKGRLVGTRTHPLRSTCERMVISRCVGFECLEKKNL